MSTRIRERVRIEAPIERVVARISSFGSIGAWHPAFDSCVVEGDGCEVDGEGEGTIRTLRVGDQVLKERLDELGEGGRGYRYTQIEGPLAATKHRGYLWISDAGDGATTVEWAAQIQGSALPDPVVEALMQGLVTIGLSAVKIDLEQG